MAGGKETPRQKLIGMMYLVLTALLALQVSSAILEKFAIIHATLDGLIVENTQKNQITLDHIIEEAGKNQNPKVLRAKENATKVREITKNAITSIDQLKAEMLKVSGTDKIDDKFINDHGSKVAYMMLDNRSPHGVGFEKLLNDYVKQMTELCPGVKFEKLAKAPEEIEMFKGNEHHANKDFRTFMFENTPPIAALASVTQIQTEILEYESRALTKLSEDANVGTIRFDKFVPMVLPKSSTVLAGTKYEGKMFLTGASSSAVPEFFRDGQKLTNFVDESGVTMGKVEFVAAGGGYDATGKAEKKFTAEIKMSDTTFRIPIAYTVVKPALRYLAGKEPTLYKDCGNNLTFEIPGYSDFSPTYSSSAAEFVKGDKPGKVTIIPKQRGCPISVSNAGQLIEEIKFVAKEPPPPSIVVKDAANKEIDPKAGLSFTAGKFKVEAEAEQNFKDEVPNDANYRIKSMNIFVTRSGAPGPQLLNYSSSTVEFSKFAGGLKKGDLVTIEPKEVVRRNFRGQEIAQKVSSRDTKTIVIK